MNSEHSTNPPRRSRPGARGQTRPNAPDTPELAERRAQHPTAQALVKATRKLFADGGPEWATDKRIHDSAAHPGRSKGVPLGTIRYYFGGSEQLLIHVARYEHLTHLDRVRRALRSTTTSEELPRVLQRLIEDHEHYQVTFGLLTEARQMPALRNSQQALAQDWLAKLADMIAELQQRRVIHAGHDPHAVALLWSSIATGLAAHRLANPSIKLTPALELVRAYADAHRL